MCAFQPGAADSGADFDSDQGTIFSHSGSDDITNVLSYNISNDFFSNEVFYFLTYQRTLSLVQCPHPALWCVYMLYVICMSAIHTTAADTRGVLICIAMLLRRSVWRAGWQQHANARIVLHPQRQHDVSLHPEQRVLFSGGAKIDHCSNRIPGPETRYENLVVTIVDVKAN